MSAEKRSEHFWQMASRRLARRINFGWWLDRWTGWVLGSALVGVVALLLARWLMLVEVRWVWMGIGALMFAGVMVAWGMERRRFESAVMARVRLEDALGMRSRLSAAAAGVGEWPEPREGLEFPVRWRWHRPVGVILFSGLMLWVAVLVPISAREVVEKRVIEKPTAVKEVEQWMAEIRKEEAVQEESVEEVEKKVADLLKRPAENWYEHGSLEAAGNLKEQTGEMLRELAQNLADAEQAASALQSAGAGLPQAAKDALAEKMKEAAQGMMAGGMKPNEQLLKQLQQMGAEGLQNLSDQQLKDLAQQLQKNSEALQEALKNAPQLELAMCQGKGPGEGEEEGPGRGGIDRGPGEAPLSLESEETNLNTKAMERLQAELDVSRLAPGDMMGTTDGKHHVDETKTGTQQGGVIESAGDGGAAVWQNSLLPDERETLRRYFK
ncbi:hypothetical protein FEM03_21190 [Phragmitibacter flavus]|uniref:Uncharacterized protein n=1 Tax=Phragmitibacter flavus TaxID=2576071 RepID=A0A5R8K8S6_9BACT|nr:hypothetical protein [Phragmitibacter flavus]TLD68701.1 hypothetical protein FEM03_21190 [Phragmitibacter flavus]